MLVPLVALSACYDDPPWTTDPPPHTEPTPDPPIADGTQTMSDVHVQPDGKLAWVLHIQPDAAGGKTTHLGAFDPAARRFDEVLDTTGTLGKKIVFPGADRVLLVTSTPTLDVLVLIDTTTETPIVERAYDGDLEDLRLSPSGRLLLATRMSDLSLVVIDTATLERLIVPTPASYLDARWGNTADVLYAVTPLGGGATDVVAYDRRDPTAPLVATPVASFDGSGYAITLAPDDRFAAVTMLHGLLGVVDLAAGTARVIEGDCEPAFTNDDRVITWTRAGTAPTYDLQLVDPTTGAATPRVASTFTYPPTSIALRTHDVVIAEPYPIDFKQGFLYDVATGAQTPIAELIDATSKLERPGHDELWMESFGELRRLDLASGAFAAFDAQLDSVDYRAATDDIIVGTMVHSLKRFSMATTAYVTDELVLRERRAPHTSSRRPCDHDFSL